MNAIVKSVDGINIIVKIALTVALIAMTITMVMQVFSRFVLDLPLHWSEELTRYLGIYAVFFGAALAIRYNELIAVEILPDLLKPTAKKVLKVIGLIISIIFFVILLVYGWNLMNLVSAQTSPAMQISMSIPYFSIPLGAFLLIINAIAAIAVTIRGSVQE
ncbi:TRAP transporter small permease [Planococcus sp. CAU13]|uniref:TRAP transporter small permease n=1 Tax=Planococcus sp. CAU13 TaxID=1541197 RepID=UPI0005300169|nr:TRAP transporter small permease [Planococcus sp. CAU13]